MAEFTQTTTIDDVLMWEKLGCVPYGIDVEKWKDNDANKPPPTCEEDDDGELRFYNGETNRPCRNLCEFEKELLKVFWSEHAPHLPIPSFKDLEIWRQTLTSPGLDAWNAFVSAHQTAAQKKERDNTIQAWSEMMHDAYWHKERNCACRASYRNSQDEPWVEPTLAQITKSSQNISSRGMGPTKEGSKKSGKKAVADVTPSKKRQTPMKAAETVEADSEEGLASEHFNQIFDQGDLHLEKRYELMLKKAAELNTFVNEPQAPKRKYLAQKAPNTSQPFNEIVEDPGEMAVEDSEDISVKESNFATLAIEKEVDDEETKDAPAKEALPAIKRKYLAKKAPKKSEPFKETAEEPDEMVADNVEQVPNKEFTPPGFAVYQGNDDEEMMGAPVKEAKTPARRTPKKAAASDKKAKTSGMSATTTPSKKLNFADLVFEEQKDYDMMDAPVKAPTTPAKRIRKPSAKKIAATTAPNPAKKRKTAAEKNADDVCNGDDETPSKKRKGVMKEHAEVEKSSNIILF
ncbi:hypothetical protein BGZ57DRAFT_970465 [Hyaloscypha finlandica]|nr:hypothetical protein BGZ57DRAFT_970465 [Hyaloscypha finlandica]